MAVIGICGGSPAAVCFELEIMGRMSPEPKAQGFCYEGFTTPKSEATGAPRELRRDTPSHRGLPKTKSGIFRRMGRRTTNRASFVLAQIDRRHRDHRDSSIINTAAAPTKSATIHLFEPPLKVRPEIIKREMRSIPNPN